MSPRFGSAQVASRHVVKGTLRSNASLFTNTRSPSRIVGFMEPVGTSFQSAMAERKAHTTSKQVSIGLAHSRQRYADQRRNFRGGQVELTCLCDVFIG